jgi:hypothetical protein
MFLSLNGHDCSLRECLTFTTLSANFTDENGSRLLLVVIAVA